MGAAAGRELEGKKKKKINFSGKESRDEIRDSRYTLGRKSNFALLLSSLLQQARSRREYILYIEYIREELA